MNTAKEMLIDAIVFGSLLMLVGLWTAIALLVAGNVVGRIIFGAAKDGAERTARAEVSDHMYGVWQDRKADSERLRAVWDQNMGDRASLAAYHAARDLESAAMDAWLDA